MEGGGATLVAIVFTPLSSLCGRGWDGGVCTLSKEGGDRMCSPVSAPTSCGALCILLLSAHPPVLFVLVRGQSTLVSALVGRLRSPAQSLLSSFVPSASVGSVSRCAAQQRWYE
eukprot:m.418907 g.418907  ORF g.418907 m.418907 type:complete len:114 (+) comp16836_c1_seq5:234-575(+)